MRKAISGLDKLQDTRYPYLTMTNKRWIYRDEPTEDGWYFYQEEEHQEESTGSIMGIWIDEATGKAMTTNPEDMYPETVEAYFFYKTKPRRWMRIEEPDWSLTWGLLGGIDQ